MLKRLKKIKIWVKGENGLYPIEPSIELLEEYAENTIVRGNIEDISFSDSNFLTVVYVFVKDLENFKLSPNP
jgi:hypothetical protein